MARTDPTPSVNRLGGDLPKIGSFSVDWTFKPNPDGTQNATINAANYWRMFLPARELMTQGDYEVIPSFNIESAEDGHLRVQAPHGEWHDDCDIVILQRWMKKGFARDAKRAMATGQVLVYDVDDNYWALPKTNIAYEYTDPVKYKDFNRAEYLKNLAACNGITVSTPMLANQLSRCGPPVFLVRNYIDINMFTPRDPREPGLVGWVGGLPWRGHDLALLRQGVVSFLKAEGLPFYHGGHIDQPGAPTAASQLGLPASMVKTKPLCDMTQVPDLWAPISVAVIPLEDTVFNRSKSWVKGLEACAMGLPFIASRLPEYEALSVGRLVDQRSSSAPQDWVDNLLELLVPDTRAAESARNRARAEQLSIQANWKEWDSVYRELV